MKNFIKLACALVLSGLVGVVQAASVSLTPSSPSVTFNNTISFTVTLDFTGTPTSGGLFDLFYDTGKLEYAGFSFNPVAGMTTYAPTIDTSAGKIAGIGFDMGGYTGGVLGTVSFSALNTAGVASVSSAAYTDSTDPLYETYRFKNDGSSSYSNVDYFNSSVQVSAVPVPAAVWLMASGLLGMLGLSRRA